MLSRHRSGLNHDRPPRIGRRGLLAGALGVGIAGLLPRSTRAAASRGVHRGLENDPSAWNTYIDPAGAPAGSIKFAPPRMVPSPDRDGEALELAIEGGDRPYTHLQGYRDLPYEDAAAFELTFHWRFSETTWNNDAGRSAIQAIEPAINKWTETNRFEWAMQWENVQDGSAEQGKPPSWRIWNGERWLDSGVSQSLKPNVWHTFRLRGEVRDGLVAYVSFKSDHLTHELGQTFAPNGPLGAPRFNVAFQLDGNCRQDPYSCLFDAVTLKWWRDSPWR